MRFEWVWQPDVAMCNNVIPGISCISNILKNFAERNQQSAWKTKKLTKLSGPVENIPRLEFEGCQKTKKTTESVIRYETIEELSCSGFANHVL